MPEKLPGVSCATMRNWRERGSHPGEDFVGHVLKTALALCTRSRLLLAPIKLFRSLSESPSRPNELEVGIVCEQTMSKVLPITSTQRSSPIEHDRLKIPHCRCGRKSATLSHRGPQLTVVSSTHSPLRFCLLMMSLQPRLMTSWSVYLATRRHMTAQAVLMTSD